MVRTYDTGQLGCGLLPCPPIPDGIDLGTRYAKAFRNYSGVLGRLVDGARLIGRDLGSRVESATPEVGDMRECPVAASVADVLGTSAERRLLKAGSVLMPLRCCLLTDGAWAEKREGDFPVDPAMAAGAVYADVEARISIPVRRCLDDDLGLPVGVAASDDCPGVALDAPQVGHGIARGIDHWQPVLDRLIGVFTTDLLPQPTASPYLAIIICLLVWAQGLS